MPEVASVPENDTASGWLYHPFLSAGRAGVAVTTGGVLSILNVRLLLAVDVPSRFDAEHVSVTPEVSAVSVLVPQPLELSSPVTTHLTVTLLVYQPFMPCVPVITSVISTSADDAAAPGTASTLAAATSSTASGSGDRRRCPPRPIHENCDVTDPPRNRCRRGDYPRRRP